MSEPLTLARVQEYLDTLVPPRPAEMQEMEAYAAETATAAALLVVLVKTSEPTSPVMRSRPTWHWPNSSSARFGGRRPRVSP